MKKKLAELKKTDIEILDEILQDFDNHLSDNKKIYENEIRLYEKSLDKEDIIWVEGMKQLVKILHRH